MNSIFCRSHSEQSFVFPVELPIRYCLELGLLPIPKTANPAHMKNNAEVNFVISVEDMEFSKKYGTNQRLWKCQHVSRLRRKTGMINIFNNVSFESHFHGYWHKNPG